MTDHEQIWPSRTYRYHVGCGKAYITVDYNKDGSIKRVCLQRNSKMKCPMTALDALSRQATYEARRDIKQAIKDLVGVDKQGKVIPCEEYSIAVKTQGKKGHLWAYSCQDAVAKVLLAESRRTPLAARV